MGAIDAAKPSRTFTTVEIADCAVRNAATAVLAWPFQTFVYDHFAVTAGPIRSTNAFKWFISAEAVLTAGPSHTFFAAWSTPTNWTSAPIWSSTESPVRTGHFTNWY